ncbi:small integral membrane protein 19 isoform X1 [Emydura macquarii macquarii]|uniref:small integral membrane protein 19 isoform X1 n=1 Tax=Emydura macquarii macquarii TaxID=1129001 RepID=UPI00352AAE02
MFMNYIREHLLLVPAAPARARVSRPRPMAAGAGGGVMSDSDAIDYSVHEAWNEATNVYLLVVLASLALLVYARRNKRKIMRIFTLPPTAEVQLSCKHLILKYGNFNRAMCESTTCITLQEQDLTRKYDQQPQKQTDSVQLSME